MSPYIWRMENRVRHASLVCVLAVGIAGCGSSQHTVTTVVLRAVSTTTTVTAATTVTEFGEPFPRADQTLVACSDGHMGDGTLAYDETAVGVSCTTVHRLLHQSYYWRSGAIVSGVGSGGAPTRSGPPGWQCFIVLNYYLRKNWDGGDLTGGVDHCDAGRRWFRFTWGRSTPWSA